jgi:DNA (cytosine-5)-methyltransferase 1
MKVGSLFTGYGGLDMAVGGELVWYAEIEKAACQVLAAHHPGVPNLGDITTINWAEVEPVDILTGGYPCQPFSHAGQRKGKNDERHLWPYVLDAICGIRPRYAILENVSGHLSLGFDSVLTDLAKIGWAAEWGTFRASDIGAPHRRERLFILAYATRGTRGTRTGRGVPEPERSTGLATHVGDIAPDTSGDGHGQQLHAGAMAGVERQATSSTQQRERSRCEFDSRGVDNAADTDWGKYAPAIRRWESVLDRPAPAPTVERKDKRRLNPQFVEWMMGLPGGWVTGHGLSAAQELKMLGNGVVPQQARAAITQLMERAQAWASSKT